MLFQVQYGYSEQQGAEMKVIYNRLLNGWYIVRGPHQTPISGRFDSREAALAHLRRRNPLHLI